MWPSNFKLLVNKIPFSGFISSPSIQFIRRKKGSLWHVPSARPPTEELSKRSLVRVLLSSTTLN